MISGSLVFKLFVIAAPVRRGGPLRPDFRSCTPDTRLAQALSFSRFIARVQPFWLKIMLSLRFGAQVFLLTLVLID